MWTNKQLRDAGLFGRKIIVHAPTGKFTIIPHPASKIYVYSNGFIIDDRPHEPQVFVFKMPPRELQKFLQRFSAYTTVYLVCRRVRIGQRKLERNLQQEVRKIFVENVRWTPSHGHKETNHRRYTFDECIVL